MLNFIRPALVSLLVGVSGCSTFSAPQRIDLLGTAIPATAAQRVIVIDPQTQYVNVIGGEIIAFTVGDQVFGWSFNGPVTVTRFDLRLIAPAGMLTHPVLAYVAPDPMYLGGNNDGGR